MKRLILIFFLLVSVCFAQPVRQVIVQPDCIVPFTFTSATTGSSYDNGFTGCVNWIVTYASTGFSALSLVVQDAPDSSGSPGTWVTFAGTVNSGINPNTATTQNTSYFTGYYRWMRVNLASKTGSGTVRGTLYGYKLH